jgi:hypothetical protein
MTAATSVSTAGYSCGSARGEPDGLSMYAASADAPQSSCATTRAITPQRSWLVICTRTFSPTTSAGTRPSKRCMPQSCPSIDGLCAPGTVGTCDRTALSIWTDAGGGSIRCDSGDRLTRTVHETGVRRASTVRMMTV